MTNEEAIDKSIEKWREIELKGGVDNGSDNCALCEKYADGGDDYCMCYKCPVFLETGNDNCQGTPFELWRNHVTSHRRINYFSHYGERDFQYKCHDVCCIPFAKSMRVFLESLR